ncbi:hypothetical protein PC120_g21518 [Phytophthora cactorum]|nr:hypothetical protein PC120_g21518 [Phytophthora cactorum]
MCTRNGARLGNEDRLRAIDDLDLYGRGLLEVAPLRSSEIYCYGLGKPMGLLAAQDCLRVRRETIKKAQVANLIKNAAKNMGLSQKDYSCHWLRTGGVCALLAAGKSDLVIRLMGRWSSWCFSVYATWNDTRRGK